MVNARALLPGPWVGRREERVSTPRSYQGLPGLSTVAVLKSRAAARPSHGLTSAAPADRVPLGGPR